MWGGDEGGSGWTRCVWMHMCMFACWLKSVSGRAVNRKATFTTSNASPIQQGRSPSNISGRQSKTIEGTFSYFISACFSPCGATSSYTGKSTCQRCCLPHFESKKKKSDGLFIDQVSQASDCQRTGYWRQTQTTTCNDLHLQEVSRV